MQVLEFHFDDENEEKLWAHGLLASDVADMLGNPHVILRNRKARRASHQVIGRDNQGRCIAVPIEPTHIPTMWRPVTAWFCKLAEEGRCP